jgi:acyl transferase domain-containing protein
MLAVALPEAALADRLDDGVSLAVASAPGRCVVSGPRARVEALRASLGAAGVDCRPVEVERAMHSALMEPVVDELAARVARARPAAPAVPYVSNVTGRWIRPEEATDPAYWGRHLRAPVRLSDGIALLAGAQPAAAFLEVGPGRAVASLVLRHPARTPEQPVLSSVRRAEEPVEDRPFLLGALGQLWASGVRVEPAGVFAGEARRRVPLPTYPFERTRYFLDPPAGPRPERDATRRPAVAEWLRVPTWERGVAPASGGDVRLRRWLVLADGTGLGPAVVRELARRGARVAEAVAGPAFARAGERRFALRPAAREDYDRLLAALPEGPPDAILHLWSVGAGAPEVLDRGFHSLLLLVQALAERAPAHPCRLAAVTAGAHRVVGDEALEPLQAAVLGPIRVAPQEIEGLTAVHVDLGGPAAADPGLPGRLVTEAEASAEPVVAYRHGLRWIARLGPPGAAPPAPRLRDGGTYLVTGGLGGVGLELAAGIAESVRHPTIVLVGRTAPAARREAAVERLARAGARVEVVTGDVADRAAMGRALARAEALGGGPVHGVVHAAGIAGGGTIALRTRESVEREFAAKVQGTLVLHDLLRDRAVDFLCLCSSTSAITGGVGSVAYTAANAFQDAFAEACAAAAARSGAAALPVVALAWDRWQGVGMAVEVERLHEALTDEALVDGIRPDEGREAFRRALSRLDLPRVVVSPRDPLALARQARDHRGTRAAGASGPPRAAERPETGAAYEAPRTETEAAIAAVWCEALGIDKVGIHDEFGALGGDSLLAVRIVARLRQELAVALPVRALYDLPTVARLASHVEAVRWARESAAARPPADAGHETGAI